MNDDRRGSVLRIQAAMQTTGGAMKIIARLRQMLFGCVAVLRDQRRRRFGLADFDRVMMRGDDKQRVQHQPKQQLRYDSQSRRIRAKDCAVIFQWRSQVSENSI